MFRRPKMILSLFCILILASTSAFHSMRPRTNIQPLERKTKHAAGVDLEDSSFIPTKVLPVPFCGQGCVLLAQPTDVSHFFNKAAIFIFQYSEADGAKGVILERPTAFNMGETSPGIGLFEGNTLYQGGDDGMDTAVMLGKYGLGGTCKYVGSGIYLGGITQARELIGKGEAVPKDFKFFFNNAEWKAGVLEKEIASGRWDVVKIPPADVLRQAREMNLWSKTRNTLISENLLKPHSE